MEELVINKLTELSPGWYIGTFDPVEVLVPSVLWFDGNCWKFFPSDNSPMNYLREDGVLTDVGKDAFKGTKWLSTTQSQALMLLQSWNYDIEELEDL